MRILVITSCTSEKKHKTLNQLKYDDFACSERLRKRTAELSNFKAPAAEMYAGRQHRPLMEGLKRLREIYGPDVVDLYIISAGYGLLSEEDIIVPYNVSFSELKKGELLERGNSLKLHQKVTSLISEYDLVFFLLSREYVQALQLCFEVPDTVTQIFLTAPSSKYVFSSFLSDIHVVCTGGDLMGKLDYATRYNFKGIVFKRLCEVICRDGLQVFEQIRENPQMLVEIILNQ